MKKRERRFFTSKIELRAVEGKELPDITGWAIRYGQLSENLGWRKNEWYEVIEPGAARDTVAQNLIDVVALKNHDPNFILGRRSEGTLELEENEEGVRYIIHPDDTTYALDLIKNIKRGDIKGSSFAMDVLTERWDIQDGKEVRHVIKIELGDVSPVTFPAYPSTNGLVGVRSIVGDPLRDMSSDDYREIYEQRHARSQSAIPQAVADLEIYQRRLKLRGKTLNR